MANSIGTVSRQGQAAHTTHADSERRGQVAHIQANRQLGSAPRALEQREVAAVLGAAGIHVLELAAKAAADGESIGSRHWSGAEDEGFLCALSAHQRSLAATATHRLHVWPFRPQRCLSALDQNHIAARNKQLVQAWLTC